MAIRSGFFNSINGDRKYDANRFAGYFATFIGNGVFPNPSDNLQVISNNDMTVTVKAGKAWIDGFILINDDDYILNIEPADGVLSRIDRIVTRYDTADREIRIEVKKGEFASTPVAPVLQRDADAYELGLADIYVGEGVISISQANITDLRLNSELCGIVHGTVDQVDTTTIFNQYEAWMQTQIDLYEGDLLAWTEDKKQDFIDWQQLREDNFDLWQAQEKTDFEAWFATVENILDGDIAGNLLNLINAHKADDVSQGEVHGLRFINKNLEYFDIETQEWKPASPPAPTIYGVEIDESNPNPETAVTYTDDAVGFTPASGNNGAFSWGSWESIIKNEFKIRPCVLNNPAKTVNYYLDYDNYNLKATGGASVLTGADGDVMTEFGTDIYTKWTVVGDKHKIQFSIEPFEGATKNAFETENGYNQFAYYPLLLTQKLFLLIFKDRDSQAALGRGYVDENSSYATTGNTNTKGFMFGETTGKQQMKFLGIEDYWGNKHQWIDGIVIDDSYNLLIGNSNFNDSGSGYISHASGVSADTYGYIETVQGGNDKGFIVKGTTGSTTTHYCDYGNIDSGRVVRFGGYLSGGSNAGFASLRLGAHASSSNAAIGARLMCVNNGKLYIGAYLGTTQDRKLRSVSGTTPSDTKTIRTFRNEARANNDIALTVLKREAMAPYGYYGIEQDIDELMAWVRAGEMHRFAVGDYFVETTSTGEKIMFEVADKNGYKYCGDQGNGLTNDHIICVARDCLETTRQFNEENTNNGGYAASLMPAALEGIAATFSEKLQSYMTTIRRLENNKGAQAWASRRIMIPSSTEMLGHLGWADGNGNGPVARSLALFTGGSAHIMKGRGFNKKDAMRQDYWLEDPDSILSVSFCFVHSNGRVDYINASGSLGVAPLIVLS